MIYEYRVYEAVPSKMAALHHVMEKLALPAFKRVGMKVVCVWQPVVGGSSNTIVYMLAFESMEDREKKWEAFRKDPEWTKGRAAFGEKEGPITTSQFNSFLAPTAYSPLK